MKPDSQRYLPWSGRKRPGRGQLSQRDRAHFRVKRESGNKGWGVERPILGITLLGLGRPGHNRDHNQANRHSAMHALPGKLKRMLASCQGINNNRVPRESVLSCPSLEHLSLWASLRAPVKSNAQQPGSLEDQEDSGSAPDCHTGNVWSLTAQGKGKRREENSADFRNI